MVGGQLLLFLTGITAIIEYTCPSLSKSARNYCITRCDSFLYYKERQLFYYKSETVLWHSAQCYDTVLSQRAISGFKKVRQFWRASGLTKHDGYYKSIATENPWSRDPVLSLYLLCYKEIIFFIWEDVSIHRTNLEYFGKSPKNSISLLLFIFWSPIYTYNYGVVFLCVWKYISVMEKLFFFVRPLKHANFHREYYPSCVTSCDEYTWPPVFLSTLFYLLKLIPCHYWSWQRNIYFLGEYFCPTYFSYVEKQHQNKDSFNNDRYDRTYWASSF